MDIDIKNEIENKLLGRKEITFAATYTGKTPSKEDIKQEICKKKGLSPDLTVVVKINQEYGKGVSDILVHSYSKKEVMESVVRKPKEDKKAAGAKPEAAAAAPAEKKAEKKEEKKEEAKK